MTAVDRRRPPLAGPPRDFRLPTPVAAELDQGLRLLVLPERSTPLVNIATLSHAGGLYNPPDRPGLAALHGSLLDEGTARHSALDLALRAESLGGSLLTGAGWHMSYAQLGLLGSDLRAGLELLAEVTIEASYPAAELERLRAEQRAEILRRSGLPAAIAEDLFESIVFADTPYGSPAVGTDASVAAISRDQVLAFRARHVTPATTSILAVGAVDPERLRADVEELFGAWRGAERPADPPARPRRPEGTTVHLVDRPQAAQTQLLVGHGGPSRRDPDYPVLRVMNTLLGGKFTSRINLSLRERHGYTYGASSRLNARRQVGSFVVGAAIANHGVGHSVQEIVAELERLRDEEPTPQELADTLEYMVGGFAGSLQTVDDLSLRLETLAVHELPLDYFDTYTARLREVRGRDVLEAARRHLAPSALTVVAVGPAQALRPQLDGLGPLTVHPAR